MKIFKQAHTRDRGSKPLFDKVPQVFWDDVKKRITLMVHDVSDGQQSSHDYWVDLDFPEIQKIIEAIAKQRPKERK